MSVRHTSDIPIEPVAAGTGAARQVLIGPEQGPNFAMRRFIIQPGGGMPLHTNTVEHEQYVLRGRARIGIGEDTYEVGSGDVVFIPEGVVHFYENTGEEPFEFLCVIPNKDDRITIVNAASC